MAITTDLFATWRRPAVILRRKLQDGPREERALAVLMAACFLLFVAQWPRLAREAHFSSLSGRPESEVPGLDALMGSSFFALVFLAPLMFYAIAALSRLVLGWFGRRTTQYGARISLFWALLCTAPLVLFHGLLTGFKGPGPALNIVGVLVFLAFVWLWSRLLREATA